MIRITKIMDFKKKQEFHVWRYRENEIDKIISIFILRNFLVLSPELYIYTCPLSLYLPATT